MDADPTLPEYDEIMDRDWFRALPQGHRERILRERKAERDRWVELGAGEEVERRRVVVAGTLLFATIFVLFRGPSLASLLVGVCAGALVGFLWWRLRAGTMLCALTSMGVYFLLLLCLGQGGLPGLLHLVGAFPLGLLSAYLGSRREVAAYE